MDWALLPPPLEPELAELLPPPLEGEVGLGGKEELDEEGLELFELLRIINDVSDGYRSSSRREHPDIIYVPICVVVIMRVSNKRYTIRSNIAASLREDTRCTCQSSTDGNILPTARLSV